MEERYIYKLENPITNKPFYVGQTSDLEQRLSGHLGGIGRTLNPEKDIILSELKKMGIVPILVPLEKTVKSTSSIREKFWVDKLLSEGHELTNHQYNPKFQRMLLNRICPSCKTEFAPNSGKQKFCSDKCKVAYARKMAKDVGLQTANQIPIPERKIEVIERSQLEGLREIELDQENGKRLRYLAKAKKVSIEDLFIWVEENYGKMVDKPNLGSKPLKETIIQDFTKENVIGKPYIPKERPDRSNFAAELRKAKCGLKGVI